MREQQNSSSRLLTLPVTSSMAWTSSLPRRRFYYYFWAVRDVASVSSSCAFTLCVFIGASFEKSSPTCQGTSARLRIADSSSTNAVNFSSARTTKRLPSSRCASAIQIVRPLGSIAGHLLNVLCSAERNTSNCFWKIGRNKLKVFGHQTPLRPREQM